MSRKRIHELAREWRVETRQVLTQLEAQGIHGKKAQSTLSEQEADAVQQALQSPAAPPLVLGEEKVVAERVVTELDQQKEHVVTAREEIRENRIRPNVIRRRKRVEVLNDDTATWSESAPVAFSAPTVEEPLPTFAPVSFDAPVQQPAPFMSEPLSAETPAFELPPESIDEAHQQEARGEVPEPSIPVLLMTEQPAQRKNRSLLNKQSPARLSPAATLQPRSRHPWLWQRLPPKERPLKTRLRHRRTPGKRALVRYGCWAGLILVNSPAPPPHRPSPDPLFPH